MTDFGLFLKTWSEKLVSEVPKFPAIIPSLVFVVSEEGFLTKIQGTSKGVPLTVWALWYENCVQPWDSKGGNTYP